MNEVWLAHHGIKGQKWGIRRFQNNDGSLTEAGRKRYLNSDDPLNRRGEKELAVEDSKRYEKSKNKLKKKLAETDKKIDDLYEKRYEEFQKVTEEETKYYDEESKKRTGMDYWTAFDKAVEQNDLLDSGKMKYEDSLWKHLNDIEEEAYDIRKTKSEKIEAKYKPQILAETKKFVEAYMDEFGTNSIYYTDVEKLAQKGATYFMMDYLDEAGYEFNYSTEGYGSPYWKRKGA